MCRQGDTVTLTLVDGRAERMTDVDRCIASLVSALNAAGFTTVASCCGHGHRPGNIALADGRELMIVASYDEARAIDGVLPDIHGVGP